MPITALLDPAEMPNRTQDQETFDNNNANLYQKLPVWGQQANALAANMNSVAAGGAYAIPYTFNPTNITATNGLLSVDNANAQSSTSFIYVNRVDASGTDVTPLLSAFDDSTSVIKGHFRLQKQGDPSKWLVLALLSAAQSSAHYTFQVAAVGGSAINPFVTGDAVMLFFQRTGDKGDTGNGPYQLIAQASINSPVASINFLNVFTSAYDRYVIELYDFAGTGNLGLRVAVGGSAVATGYTTAVGPNGSIGSGTSNTGISLTNNLVSSVWSPFKVEIAGVNSTLAAKTIAAKGGYYNGSSGYTHADFMGMLPTSSVLSGFQLLNFDAVQISRGTVRVYGIKNN